MATVTSQDLRRRLTAEVPGLLRYARTIARDNELAEDLVQETLLRGLQRAESFRGEASLATWLHRILHNLAVDRLRASREDPIEDIEAEVERRWRDDSYTVDGPTVVERAETREELRDALVRLPVIRCAVGTPEARSRTTSTTTSWSPTGCSWNATSRPARRCMPPWWGPALPRRLARPDTVVPVSLADRIKELLNGG